MRLTNSEIDAHVAAFNRDGMVMLRGHFSKELLTAWRTAFEPLLQAHIASDRDNPNRGAQRHYVTLPFAGLFADPAVHADPDVLAIVERVAGADPVLCQLASDTPLLGSDYQAWHRDTPPLFEEWGRETPSFQLAVNFPLCDVTPENGPLETTLGTHLLERNQALAQIKSAHTAIENVAMQLGDVLIRDVRQIHRGTPNRTDQPRPMVVLGYSRRWLYRPEVQIRVPQSTWDALPAQSRQLLRFNPIVSDADAPLDNYRQFAY
ncbi:phytanoyl-CoA dioxygenase family protein [Rhodoferax sp.]|uniref:phytanoyl-CoA dioxygenase family protein n=1 Tax=Rhodoferax sp. TaxID=50421 RepID=UPI00374D61D1